MLAAVQPKTPARPRGPRIQCSPKPLSPSCRRPLDPTFVGRSASASTLRGEARAAAQPATRTPGPAQLRHGYGAAHQGKRDRCSPGDLGRRPRGSRGVSMAAAGLLPYEHQTAAVLRAPRLPNGSAQSSTPHAAQVRSPSAQPVRVTLGRCKSCRNRKSSGPNRQDLHTRTSHREATVPVARFAGVWEAASTWNGPVRAAHAPVDPASTYHGATLVGDVDASGDSDPVLVP